MLPLDRLFQNSIPEPNSGCWLWTAGVDRCGYGQIKVRGLTLKAHRVSYEAHRGKIPSGLRACHICDVPSCINPDHIFLGSDADNMRDAAAKGRKARKLSSEDIAKIRGSSKTQRAIAREFGINHGTVSRIRARHVWGHVP